MVPGWEEWFQDGKDGSRIILGWFQDGKDCSSIVRMVPGW